MFTPKQKDMTFRKSDYPRIWLRLELGVQTSPLLYSEACFQHALCKVYQLENCSFSIHSDFTLAASKESSVILQKKKKKKSHDITKDSRYI